MIGDLSRSLLEALAEPALIVERGLVRQANASARAVLGEGIEGRDVRLAIRHPAAVERLLGSGEPEPGEIELTGLGERDRRWVMSLARLRDGAALVRLMDRSEAHAAEKMRVDFVANASHELRTPLATLVGYSETLREQDAALDPATRARFTAIIHDEAVRMKGLVEDLISLSRIEGERFSTPRDRLNLRQLLEQVRESCRRAAEERSCDIRIDAAQTIPPIAGDRAQILQLCDNIVSNALRYGRHGTVVSVSIASAGSMVRLSVTDQGEGIAAEHIPRLTERFYRVDPSRSRGLGGTGLGLSIVKHIVERHRGRLDISSVVGEGTCVTVHLPAAQESVS